MTNDKEQSWFVIEITVDAGAAEAVEFAINELDDSAGTEINLLGKTGPQETVCVIGYFGEQPDDARLRNELAEALRIYNFPPAAIKGIARRRLGQVDWLQEWKKHWRPTETEKFIVAPPWEKIEAGARLVIQIEPSMAFGTGTHQTTRLCLKAIEENFRSGMSLLDVGTGTGILAIAAVKLREQMSASDSPIAAESVPGGAFLACDTDADSVAIARENAELNGAADRIEFYVGSISEDTPAFDFVCANLTIDVIVPLLPLLLEKTRQVLILSGILKEQEEQITAALEKLEVSDRKIETDGEWISVLVDKDKQTADLG